MTTTENYLALLLVKENFGEIPRLICNHLIRKKSYPLQLIASDLDIDRKVISQTLTVLLIHNLIEYSINSKKIIEYKFCTQAVLNLLKRTRNISKIEVDYGNFSSLIIEQFYLNGSIQMSLIILKVVNYYIKLNNITDEEKISSLLIQIKQNFIKLFELGFLEKVPKITKAEDDKVTMYKTESEETEIPEIKFNDSTIKKLNELNEFDTMLQINEVS